jgi:hypothetical protein
MFRHRVFDPQLNGIVRVANITRGLDGGGFERAQAPPEVTGVIDRFLGRATGLVASGVVGAVAYDGVKRLVRGDVLHGAAVAVTSWGLRGARVAETGAEKARLTTTADIVSEARGKLGEQSPPPGTAASANNHEH